MRIVKFIILLIKKWRALYFVLIKEINAQATIIVDKIIFSTPSELCAWRAETLFKKEPETINWIETFESNDVFWDVGANVGIYSIYAAVKRKVKVYAFEPSPFNFYVLSKNIYLNNISSKVNPFCIAFTDNTKIDYLNLTSVNEGAAHTAFKTVTNEFGDIFEPEYSQATLGYSIENFIKTFNLKIPNHIKIDVDGAEKCVVDGALNILKNVEIKSILIEMNSQLKPDEKEIFNAIVANGFYLQRSDHPDGDLRLLNYIFRRS